MPILLWKGSGSFPPGPLVAVPHIAISLVAPAIAPTVNSLESVNFMVRIDENGPDEASLGYLIDDDSLALEAPDLSLTIYNWIGSYSVGDQLSVNFSTWPTLGSIRIRARCADLVANLYYSNEITITVLEPERVRLFQR